MGEQPCPALLLAAVRFSFSVVKQCPKAPWELGYCMLFLYHPVATIWHRNLSPNKAIL